MKYSTTFPIAQLEGSQMKYKTTLSDEARAIVEVEGSQIVSLELRHKILDNILILKDEACEAFIAQLPYIAEMVQYMHTRNDRDRFTIRLTNRWEVIIWKEEGCVNHESYVFLGLGPRYEGATDTSMILDEPEFNILKTFVQNGEPYHAMYAIR